MAASDQLRSNRDLYLFMTGLAQRPEAQTRGLEEYLRSLWRIASRLQSEAQLSLSSFAHLLETALSAEAPAFDRGWRARADETIDNSSEYRAWEQTIFSQIVDLRDMADAGMLANDLRYFGIDAPRGGRWYNFDILGYLECATAGTFGGWNPGDDSDRRYTEPTAICRFSLSWSGIRIARGLVRTRASVAVHNDAVLRGVIEMRHHLVCALPAKGAMMAVHRAIA
jgi:hypothetical protein